MKPKEQQLSSLPFPSQEGDAVPVDRDSKLHDHAQTINHHAHLYTVPNRIDAFYSDPALLEDIKENPTLYVDRADF